MKKVSLGVSILWIILLSFVGFCPFHAFADASDDVTCWVRSNCDNSGSIEAFNCLRHKIEQGYNTTTQRACVDRIVISNKVGTITLKKPLVIDNERDENCEGDSPYCRDEWGLILEGTATVDIDIQEIKGECGITIKSNSVQLNHINFLATSEQVDAKKVICDEGEGNELNYTINGHEPEPSEGPGPITPPNDPGPVVPVPPTGPTEAPSNLVANLTGTSPDYVVNLTWTDNSSDEDGFKIEKAMLAGGKVNAICPYSNSELNANVTQWMIPSRPVTAIATASLLPKETGNPITPIWLRWKSPPINPLPRP
jgi:hypothetical protein